MLEGTVPDALGASRTEDPEVLGPASSWNEHSWL